MTTLSEQQNARVAPRYYCGSCGHNTEDERCADPIVPPQHAKEYAAIHRAAIAATSAIASVSYVGYPASFYVELSDLEAIEAFIVERLRARCL